MSDGYVYFIRPVGMAGPIKIGFAYDPDRRCRQLQFSSPVELEVIGSVNGAMRDEYAVQAYLADHQSHGEWFRSSDRVNETVQGIISGRISMASLQADRKSPCKARGKWSQSHRRAFERARTASNRAIGERLQAARLSAGYKTAAQAADALGVAVSTYIQHENGTRGVTFATAKKYADCFGVYPGQIAYGYGNKREAA